MSAARPTSDLDPTRVHRLVEQMSTLRPMELVLRPDAALSLAGLLQLVLRHPGIRDDAMARAVADRFLEGVHEYFAECPAVLELLDQGDDPAEDLPWA